MSFNIVLATGFFTEYFKTFTTMPLKYEFYAKQVPAGKLDQEVDAMNDGAERHLVAIAKELMDMEVVAPQLNILPKDVRDIEEKYPNNPASRRYANEFHCLLTISTC